MAEEEEEEQRRGKVLGNAKSTRREELLSFPIVRLALLHWMAYPLISHTPGPPSPPHSPTPSLTLIGKESLVDRRMVKEEEKIMEDWVEGLEKARQKRKTDGNKG